MPYVKLNYPNAVTNTDKIKYLSQDVEALYIRLKRAFADTDTYWKGQAADEYRLKAELLEERLKQLKEKMEKTAVAIRKLADEVKAADEAAAAVLETVNENAVIMTRGVF